MIVAGLGFRRGAGVASLRAALLAAEAGGARAGMLATVVEKAEAPALHALARERCVPIRAVSPEDLRRADTTTQSARVAERFGTGSVAEAAALAAAGPGARLRAPRAVSPDGMAVAAIAITQTGTDL